ncbi:MAG TPA: SurA N-terminal domain-containing protein [Nitrospirota bacterium]|nr:SurA N-terminal domain-containing protein [Nitrospirota bacterium]
MPDCGGLTVHCPDCKQKNDADALFCTACGRPLEVTLQKTAQLQHKAYFIALLFVPVIAIAAGIGYYKFFLPNGVAAVVNGEEIRLSELDAAVARAQGRQEVASSQLRYQLLNQLITQRIVIQEARKSGISVSEEEIETFATESRASSGIDEATFNRQVVSQYGSLRAFKDALVRRLLADKFLAVKVVPPGADQPTAQSAIKRWLDDIAGRAAVRIALAEQGEGPGCGCCNTENGQASQRSGIRAHGCAAVNKPSDSDVGKAADAGLRFWHAKYGPESVTTLLTGYGCHIQVDIVKDNKIIGSLRYQDGNITEI